MNRTTYEHAVIYLSKQIRTSMVESFNLIDSDGYIIAWGSGALSAENLQEGINYIYSE